MANGQEISEQAVVALGTWWYDGVIEKRMQIWRKPARLAHSRFVNDGENEPFIDEALPVPATPDGMIYMIDTGMGGEFETMEQAMRWAESQPWAPVVWEVLAEPRRRLW